MPVRKKSATSSSYPSFLNSLVSADQSPLTPKSLSNRWISSSSSFNSGWGAGRNFAYGVVSAQTDTDTERHRQTKTDTDRHTDRHRQTQTYIHRLTQTDTDSYRLTHTDTDCHRHTQTATD